VTISSIKETTMTTMRAKLKVTNVVKDEGGAEALTFAAVYKATGYEPGGLDEDNTYATYTPFAELKMIVNNPALAGKFSVGDTFYVDFTPV
jgi:hypothetical protein